MFLVMAGFLIDLESSNEAASTCNAATACYGVKIEWKNWGA